jgi:NitT/TauT family transport system substrate-binding protein
VRVAVTPSVEAAPALLGSAQGMFSAAGLDVRWVRVSGNDAAVDAVASGKADFGVAQAAAVLRIATAKALPLQIVSGASAYRPRTSAVVVKTAAAINGAGDLPAKTVAVPAIGGFAYLSFLGWLTDAGNDPSTVRVVALPSFAMAPALQAGLVDAAVIESPFLESTLTPRSGLRAVADSATSSLGPSATAAVWFASKRQKASSTRLFVRAIGNSLAYARTHPDEVRSRLPEGKARSVALPQLVAPLNVASLEIQAVLIAGLALTEQVPDVTAMLWRGAPRARS